MYARWPLKQERKKNHVISEMDWTYKVSSLHIPLNQIYTRSVFRCCCFSLLCNHFFSRPSEKTANHLHVLAFTLQHPTNTICSFYVWIYEKNNNRTHRIIFFLLKIFWLKTFSRLLVSSCLVEKFRSFNHIGQLVYHPLCASFLLFFLLLSSFSLQQCKFHVQFLCREKCSEFLIILLHQSEF